MTLGVDKLWRKKIVKKLDNIKNGKILDIATGTGDLAIEIKKKCSNKIYGIDISEKMIEIANKKIRKLGFKNIIECTGDSGNMLLNFIKNNKNKIINRGNVIYVGAKEISFNLPKKLSSLGYKVKRYKIYSTEAINQFSSNFLNLVKKRKIKLICFALHKF